jgi:hypothetical protein
MKKLLTLLPLMLVLAVLIAAPKTASAVDSQCNLAGGNAYDYCRNFCGGSGSSCYNLCISAVCSPNTFTGQHCC